MLITGSAASAAFSVWQMFGGKTFTGWIGEVVAIILLLSTAFLAWSNEHDVRVEAEMKLDSSRPDFDGEIVQALAGPASAIIEHKLISRTSDFSDSVIVLLVRLWNKTKMDRVNAKTFTITVEFNGAVFHGTQHCDIPELRRIVIEGEGPTDPHQTIDIRFGYGDIWYLNWHFAYLGFYVSGLDYQDIKRSGKEANITLTVTDLLDHAHDVKITNATLIVGRVSYGMN